MTKKGMKMMLELIDARTNTDDDDITKGYN